MYGSFDLLRKYVLDNFGSEKMTPEIRDSLFEYHDTFVKSMCECHGNRTPSYITVLRKEPTICQKQYLAEIHELGKDMNWISTKMLGRNLVSAISLYMLEYMGTVVVRKNSIKKAQIINKPSTIQPKQDIMEKYWPRIESWKTNLDESISREKVSYGQREAEVLKIIGKDSLDNATEEEIENLSSIDWKLHGMEFPTYGLTSLKHRLLKKISQ